MLVCNAVLGAAIVALAAAASRGAPDKMTDASADLLPLALTNGKTMDAELADLDGDGHADLVLAVEFGQNAVLVWRDGRFEHARDALPQGVLNDSEDIAIADLDGDGRPDLVFASEDTERNELYLNAGVINGEPVFEDATDRLPVEGVSNAVAAFDADGDGDTDLLFGNKGRNALLLNNGDGRFTHAPDALPPIEDTTQDIEVGDLDADGHPDLVIANEDANRVLRNRGDGTFEDITERSIGLRSSEETREADLGDVDGDGDPDLYFANVGWAGFAAADKLLINNGDGTFTDESLTRLPVLPQFSLDIDFADLDGDGDLDAVLARIAQGFGRPVAVLLNDGKGRFTEPVGVLPEGIMGQGIDVEVADLDGDGTLDIYVATHFPADLALTGR